MSAKQPKNWRAVEIKALSALVGKVYDTNENQWQRFLSDQGLPVEYLAGVRQVIDSRKWQAKTHPIAWVRRVAKAASYARFELQESTYEKYARQQENRRVISVGNHVPKFTGSARQPDSTKGYEIAPSLIARGRSRRLENNSKFDDDSIDYLTEKYLDEEYDYAVLHMGQFHLPIPDSIAKEDGSPDWGKFADRFDLDAGGRLVLLCRLLGIGREEMMDSRPKNRAGKKEADWFQAAWRKFDRHMKEMCLSTRSGPPLILSFGPL